MVCWDGRQLKPVFCTVSQSDALFSGYAPGEKQEGAGASGRDGGEGTCKGVEIPGIKTPCCMGRLTLPKRRIFYRRRRKMGHMGNM